RSNHARHLRRDIDQVQRRHRCYCIQINANAALVSRGLGHRYRPAERPAAAVRSLAGVMLMENPVKKQPEQQKDDDPDPAVPALFGRFRRCIQRTKMRSRRKLIHVLLFCPIADVWWVGKCRLKIPEVHPRTTFSFIPETPVRWEAPGVASFA